MATFDLVMPPAPVPTSWVTRYVLEDRTYWFEFTINDRDGFWYLRVGGELRTTELTAIKLVLGTDILSPYKYRDVPPGMLDVVDVTGAFIEPSYEDFGSRVILRYTDFVDTSTEPDELFPLDVTPPA